MGIGIGILFLAVGAILAFATDVSVNGLDLNAVGIILMVVGALAIVLDLVIFMPRRRSQTTVVDRGVEGQQVTERRDVY